MIFLTLDEVIELHGDLIAGTGGNPGLRDRGLLESALAQPLMAFGGVDLYPTIAEKAAALGFSLAKNHAFQDGNKRIAHAAMETFLVMNGFEVVATVDEQEDVFLRLAAGRLGREEFTDWLRGRVVAIRDLLGAGT